MTTSRCFRIVAAGFACVTPAFLVAQEPAPQERTVSLSGMLHILWGDPPAGSGLPVYLVSVLSDEGGVLTELIVDEEVVRAVGGLLSLQGRQITISGAYTDQHSAQVRVHSITVGDDGVAAGAFVTGSQAFVTILCRFSDATGITPHARSWFQTLMGGTYPGLDDYWREVSYNLINLNGSDVVGWYNLPHTRSYYVYDSDADGVDEADLGRLLNDCTAAADADVFFPNFLGINMMFNQPLDCCAWGGPNNLNRDGQNRSYAMAWLPPWAYDPAVVGHEMGHGFGLPHSSGPYAGAYDSQWDVMSGGGMCAAPDVNYGCVGVHTIAYHKWLLGWIPGSRHFESGGLPQAATIIIERIAAPPGGNYLIASLWADVDSPSRWYTVETRRRSGYDDEIPGDAVVIHDVDPLNRPNDRTAQVVDPDGNGNPNDGGAMWLSGEWFLDVADSVLVFVERETATGFEVSLTNSPRDPAYVDLAAAGREDGSASAPWNTLAEGYTGVIPRGTLLCDPGNYPGPMTMRKPLTLHRWGSSGSVVIGE
ncbi:MAG: hypothetical protein V1790_19430 [Planctomycetota bacterium]